MVETKKSNDIYDDVDEIDNLNKRNINSKQKISKLKQWTIKNMVYTNVQIPNNWKHKLDYRDIMFSTISKDKIFFDFLSQKLNINDEAKNFKKKKKEANQYNESQILPEIDNKVTHNKKRNMFNNINDYNLQSLNSITSSGFSSQIKSFTTTNNFRKSGMIKTGEFDNLEKMAMKKRHEIKSLNKTDNLVNVKKSKSNLQLKKHNVTNTNSQYGPFLHIVSNTKKIEIKNKDVKNLVEQCKNYGPFYSHCPSCNNRNMSFYQNMNSEQAMKLLTYIRDNRLKSSNK